MIIRAIAIFLISFIPFYAYAEDLTVAAAASLAPVLEELRAVFEGEWGLKIKTVTGSSGKLTAQIENGAPFDIFLSADMQYPGYIYAKGLSSMPPRVYAYGVLILWTTKGLDLSRGVSVLKDEAIKTIALADAQAAPYGRAALSVLDYYDIYPELESRLVYGESIAQANAFVVSGAADIGFSAKSSLFNPNLSAKVEWVEVPPESYQRIAQGGLILKYGEKNNPGQSSKFYNFLFSGAARDIFREYGYTVDE